MSACDDKPSYVYKLVSYTSPVPLDPADLPVALPVSTLDQTSGFIHLSTAPQILGTLVHFFGSDPRVFVLRLAYEPLERAGRIKWEDPKGEVCGPRPGEGLFPHLYHHHHHHHHRDEEGVRLGREEVESVRALERGGGVGWEEAIEGDAAFRSWLAY